MEIQADVKKGVLAVCCDVFAQILENVEVTELELKIPGLGFERQKVQFTNFHIIPEMFIQISGSTLFRFPSQKFRLDPSEICIVPRNTPHFESIPSSQEPFYNLVIGYGSSHISMHIANENHGGPQILEEITYYSAHAVRSMHYMDQIVETWFNSDPHKKLFLKGLLISLFSSLLSLVTREVPQKCYDHPKILRCKELIQKNIANSGMNVKILAQWIGCSADYLSHLFYKETSVYLVDFILSERLVFAKQLLSSTTMSISEVAWACGYSDIGYFGRVFKKASGKTAREYRRQTT